MTKKKAVLRYNAYTLIEDAVEHGLQFAMNRLEDCNVEITEEQRAAALPRMMNEMMIALSDVINWEKSE